MTNPQEFVRLCNAVLAADHGDDFLPIDDDQKDAGNDGYLKSERRMFAMHCFKRAQKQSINDDIRRKMEGDLKKAIALRDADEWAIDAWTFVSNYPMPEEVGRHVFKLGAKAGIDVSWRGPGDLALGLRRHPELHPEFPELTIDDLAARIEAVQTGGDTFCYAMLYDFDLPESLARQFVVIRKGEHVLYDVRLDVWDLDASAEISRVQWGELNAVADYVPVRWSLEANVYYVIHFFARNGNWSQELQLRRSESARCWLAATRVLGTDGGARFEHIDSGFVPEFGEPAWRI